LDPAIDVKAAVAELRAEGGDLPAVEVKAAAGGLPESIVPRLCAFANRPGGGTVILGLDEASGFTPVGLADRRRLKASLVSKARQSLDPPVVPEISEGLVDGEAVVVAVVPSSPLRRSRAGSAEVPIGGCGSERGTVTTARPTLRSKGYSPGVANLDSTANPRRESPEAISTLSSSTSSSARAGPDQSS